MLEGFVLGVTIGFGFVAIFEIACWLFRPRDARRLPKEHE